MEREHDCAYYTEMANLHYLEVNLAEACMYNEWYADRMRGSVKTPEYKKVLHLIDFVHERGATIMQRIDQDGVAVQYTGGRWVRYDSVKQAESDLRARGFMTRQEFIDMRHAAKSFQEEKA